MRATRLRLSPALKTQNCYPGCRRVALASALSNTTTTASSFFAQAMPKSTLHRGVRDLDADSVGPTTTTTTTTTTYASSSGGSSGHRTAGLSQNLGDHFDVKSDARAAMEARASVDGYHSAAGRRGATGESCSFEDALAILDDMTSGPLNRSCENLDITNRLLDRLDMRPAMARMRFVHIAGTKGKGTTAAYTAALLQGYGFKVGLFTSPHLTDIRERIMVDNRLLSKDTFARYFFEFHHKYNALRFSDSDGDRDAASRSNYFRFLFLLSIHIYAAESVDVAVMEVGLGGRIDATNTIPSTVSIITSLGYDHMVILGNTLADITREKAGIMRPDVLCLAAPQRDHPEARKALESASKARGTPLILLDDNVLPIRSWPLLAIGGDHAVEDSKLALMAARHLANIPPVLPLDEMERTVLRQMTFTGRSQIVSVDGGRDMTLYLDGAHTPESLMHALRWFTDASAAVTQDAKPRRVLLLFTSRDPRRILKSFMPFISSFTKVVIAQTDNNPKMAAANMIGPAAVAHAEEREQRAREEMIRTTECWRDMYREVTCLPCGKPFTAIEDLLDLIVPAAAEGEDASKPAQVLVTGSLYLVGDLLKLLAKYERGGRRTEE